MHFYSRQLKVKVQNMSEMDMASRLLAQDFLSVSDLQKLTLSQLSLNENLEGLHKLFAIVGRFTFIFMNYDRQ